MSKDTLFLSKWWFKKRVQYNLALLFTGLMGFVAQAVNHTFKADDGNFNQGLLTQMCSSGMFFLLFLILANLAFIAGWVIDLIFNFKNSLSFRERLFLIGHWFAIACLTVSIIAFLQLI